MAGIKAEELLPAVSPKSTKVCLLSGNHRSHGVAIALAKVGGGP
jgi:hypothetical protein